MKHNIFFS